jgi:hypothetical protein
MHSKSLGRNNSGYQPIELAPRVSPRSSVRFDYTNQAWVVDGKYIPAEVRACFHVENNSDIQSDYFDNDSLRVCSNHPLYALVKAAYDAHEAHFARLKAKRQVSA